MESLIGTTIGGYKLTRAIGTGPTGQVLAAVDSIGGPSAIKLLHPGLSLFTKVESYWDEVQRVAALSHPHITAASAADWSRAGRFFLAMDLLEGIDLHQALAAGRIPPSQTLLFAGQVCLALEAAHEIGAVHGALKPHNIFLVAKGGDPGAFSTRLMDFATCMLINTSVVPSSPPGTSGAPEASYLAPEQFGGESSPASDIYALGVILYESLSGRRPFVGSHEQLAVAHNKTEPEPPTHVPAGLAAIILKALAKAPSARYATVAELREALEDWAAKGPPELETPALALFAKKAGEPGVVQEEAESTVKVALAELSMAVDEPPSREAILMRLAPAAPAKAPAAPAKKEEPKKVAEQKKPAATAPQSDAKMPHDAELAAIAAKAAAPLKPEKRPAAEEKRTPLAAGGTEPEAAKPERPTEGYLDEDGDFVELPLEKSVKAFVSTLAPVVAPPISRARAGGNGESLDAALDQFVRDAKAWSSALPQPVIDDRRLAELAKVPEPEPPPAPPKPAEPELPPAPRLEPLPAQPRSVLLPSILSFVLGGAVIFGVVWFLGFGPKKNGGETGTQEQASGSAATKPDDKKAATPQTGPIVDGAPAVVAKPLDAGAPAAKTDGAPAVAATPDAKTPAATTPDAGVVTPAPKVAKVKKVRKGLKKKAAVVKKKVEKKAVEPKAKKGKKGKKDSDWVDPFSQ